MIKSKVNSIGEMTSKYNFDFVMILIANTANKNDKINEKVQLVLSRLKVSQLIRLCFILKLISQKNKTQTFLIRSLKFDSINLLAIILSII